MFYIYISNLFLLESYKFTNIKNNSLFIVQENTRIYLDGIMLAQSERKENVYKKLLEQGENIKWKNKREHLKCSVANKIILIFNAKKFLNVNNMKNFDRVTSFTKFNIYCIVPKPSRVDFPCIFQLTTLVFMAHALQYAERTRKLQLMQIFRFILVIFPVNKNSPFKFPAFKFHNNQLFFLQMMASL